MLTLAAELKSRRFQLAPRQRQRQSAPAPIATADHRRHCDTSARLPRQDELVDILGVSLHDRSNGADNRARKKQPGWRLVRLPLRAARRPLRRLSVASDSDAAGGSHRDIKPPREHQQAQAGEQQPQARGRGWLRRSVFAFSWYPCLMSSLAAGGLASTWTLGLGQRNYRRAGITAGPCPIATACMNGLPRSRQWQHSRGYCIGLSTRPNASPAREQTVGSG